MDRSKNSSEVSPNSFYAWKDVPVQFLRKVLYARTFVWIGLLVTFCTLSYFLTVSDKIYGNTTVKNLLTIDSGSVTKSPKKLSDVSKLSQPENEPINLNDKTSEKESFNQPVVISNEEATVSPNDPEVEPLIKHVNDNEDIIKMKRKELQEQANDLMDTTRAASQDIKTVTEDTTVINEGPQEKYSRRSSYEMLEQRREGEVRQRLPVGNNNKMWQSLQKMEQGLNNMLPTNPTKRALQVSYRNDRNSHQVANIGDSHRKRTLTKLSQSKYPEVIYEENPPLLGQKREHYINVSPATTSVPTNIKMSHPIARVRDSDNMQNLNLQILNSQPELASQSKYPEIIYKENTPLLGKKRAHYVNASPVPTHIRMSHPIARVRDSDNMYNLNSQIPERETTADIRNEHREQTTPTPSSTLAEEETTETSTLGQRQNAHIRIENVHDGPSYGTRRDYSAAGELYVPEFSQSNNEYHGNYVQMYPQTDNRYINEANSNNRALNPSRIVSVPQQGHVLAKRPKKKVVIISTRYRSGSTFTGEMFNQNPNYFFTFEPLHSFKRKVLGFASLSDAEKGNRRRALLESIFLCNHNTDYRPAPNFLSMTKAVSRFTGCPIPETLGKKLEPECSAKAKAVIAQLWLVPELCSKYKYSAVKTIRANISDLVPLLDHDQLDVKIIQLIRDPRGMFRSWFPKLNNNDEEALKKLKRNVSSTCKQLLMNFYDGERLRQIRPDRYMLLRYEDLAANPVEVVKAMYSFSGTELHNNVLRWIHFNTGQSEQLNAKKVQRRFGTFRTDSRSTATKWKSDLPYSAIRIIEDNCREFILNAGYNLFDPSTTTTFENLR